MNENIKAFSDLFETEECKETLALGDKIKKLDKSNDKKMTFIILTSMITMTVLGFVAFGVVGAILFFAITAIASFWLYYSSKKNVLLKYLTFYRTRVPKLIAQADGIEVKAEEIPHPEFVATLSDSGKLAYRMCHRYGDLYIGFAKFMVSGEPILQGLLYFTEGEGGNTESLEALLGEEFNDYVIKSENGKSMLFIPGVEDYLNGRVEMKDDLTLTALIRQYDYYLLGKSFRSAVNGGNVDSSTIFHEL